MNTKWIKLACIGLTFFTVACNNEEDPIASENLGIVEMFSPGADADQEVKDIYNEYGAWIRTSANSVAELANAIIYEDGLMAARGSFENLDDASKPEVYAYMEAFLSNVSPKFAKTYFPQDFFFLKSFSTYTAQNMLTIGRNRIIIAWPNQMAGSIPVTDPEEHYYQDSVLTTTLWGNLVGMITPRMEEDLLPDFIAAGKMYDGGEAIDNINNQFKTDNDTVAYENAVADLTREGGFITSSGSRDFRTDIGNYIELLATESYDNIKKDYLDDSPARTMKYEIVVKWLKDSFDWDIQAAGNKFRTEYDAYKATLPPPAPDEGSDESEETE